MFLHHLQALVFISGALQGTSQPTDAIKLTDDTSGVPEPHTTLHGIQPHVPEEAVKPSHAPITSTPGITKEHLSQEGLQSSAVEEPPRHQAADLLVSAASRSVPQTAAKLSSNRLQVSAAFLGNEQSNVPQNMKESPGDGSSATGASPAGNTRDGSHGGGQGDGQLGGRVKVGHSASEQHHLYDDLFKTYNKNIRPIIFHDDVLTVHFNISLFNILSLNTKEGIIVTNTQMIMTWTDPYLTWNPADYNGTTFLRVHYSDVWHPDIILYNTADTSYETSLIHTNVIIAFDGTCKLQVHAVFTSVCNIDVQWFPFDQQTCELIFGSWTSDVDQMRLQMGNTDITRFIPNHEFFLENFYAEAKELFNPCCERPFSMIVYYIQLQRRVKFALFFFITPGVLINVCALLVFSLPAESGEKISMGINSLLAMMVFLMAMIDNLPPTENLPLAGVYYGGCLVVVTMNIGFSVYVLSLSHSGERDQQVPLWLRSFTAMCSRIVRMSAPKVIVKAWNLDVNLKVRKDKVQPHSGSDDESDEESLTENKMQVRVINLKPNYGVDGADMFKDPYQRRSLQALEGIQLLLSKEASMHKSHMKKSSLMQEWKYISRVMDRLLFYVFCIGTLLFNAIILSQSPFGVKFEYCSRGAGMCTQSGSTLLTGPGADF